MVSLLTLLGFALGWASPTTAVYLLLAFVGVTSSLPWHLGFGNQATALGYTAGLVAGYAACRALKRAWGRDLDADRATAAASGAEEPGTAAPGHRPIAPTSVDPTVCAAAIAAMALITIATIVALARDYRVPAEALVPLLRATAENLATFNPPGLAGTLQAAAVAALGYAVFLVAASTMRAPRNASGALAAFHVGVTIAVASPVVQVLFLDPTVRPDRGRDSSLGLVGFFQDPHGYAAFLVLAVNVTAATAIGNWRRERRRPALAGAVLTVAAVVALLLTGSRTGAAIGLATLVGTSATTAFVGTRRRRATAMMAVAVTASIVMIGGLVIMLATSSGFSGPARLLKPLDPEVGVGDLVEGRLHRAWVAAELIRERPLWGLGPGGYFDAQLTRWVQGEPRPTFGPVAENVHNYYLQLAADYGIPVLLAFCIFWGLIGARMAGAIRVEPRQSRRSLLLGIGAGVGGLLLFSLVSHPFLVAELHALAGAFAGWGYAVAGAGSEAAVMNRNKRRPGDAAVIRGVHPGGDDGDLTADGIVGSSAAPRWVAVVVAGLLAAAAVEVVRLSVVPAARTPRDTGLYGWEEAAPGNGSPKFRWTRESAWLRRQVHGDVVSLPVFVSRPDLAERPISVVVSVDSIPVQRVSLADNGWHTVDIYVPPPRAGDGTSARPPNRRRQIGVDETERWRWKELQPWDEASLPSSVWFEVRVDRTFVPAQLLAVDDGRRLGVGLGVLAWAADLPPEGIGFHDVEQDSEGPFRWTGMAASVAVHPRAGEVVFRVLAANPDIAEVPLPLSLSWNGDEVAIVILRSASWTAVSVPVGSDEEVGVLTIRAERTWSPSRRPGRRGSDHRELGVAVRGLGEGS